MKKKKIPHTKKIDDAIADFMECVNEGFSKWPKEENETDLIIYIRGAAKVLYLDLDDML